MARDVVMAPHHESTASTEAGSRPESTSELETRALSLDEHSGAAAAARPDAEGLTTGEAVGRYLVLEPLGRGGMSFVYVAYDPKLDRRVALKVMRPDGNERPEEAQRRLLREATAMAKLAHPNVVRVYDVGTIGARVYMAMELVEGLTLRDWSTAKPRRWREIVAVLARAGRGLAAAHEAGLVHLDFKPSNVLVGTDGEVRVVDFGLARSGASVESGSVSGLDFAVPAHDTVTHVGTVMGTPGYMAPEQLDGTPPDARADQFAFCVTAWELLYGQRPFAGRRLDSYREALRAGERVEPPAEARVPVRLRRLLERGLSIDPALRHPSLARLLDEMMRDPWRPVRRTALLWATAGGIGVAGWGLVRTPEDPCANQAQRIVDAWSPERQAKVLASLSAGDPARPRPIAEELTAKLDAYAVAWTEAATDACRSGREAGHTSDALPELRSYCLDHRHRALRAATDLMLEPDSERDTPWDRVVSELPSLAVCRDVTSAYEVGRPPPDEALRERVEAVDEQRARSQALLAAGQHARALTVIEEAVLAAEATAHRPTLAKVALAHADVLSTLDRAQEAERAGFEAVRLADVEGMHAVRLGAYATLVHVVGMLAGRPQEAENIGQTGLWLEEQVVHDSLARARLLSNLGAADMATGHTERARERFLEALEINRDDELLQATARQGLGGAYHQLGDYERALETFRAARDSVLERYGPEHPLVLLSWENEATALHALERYEDALAVLEQARPYLSADGIENASQVPFYATLSAVLIELRRFDEAEGALEHVRRTLETSGLRPLLLGVTHGNLAMVALERGQGERALAHARPGLTIIAEILGPDHVYYAWFLGLQARAERETGAPLAALEHAATAWTSLLAADERHDGLAEPEYRAEAALVISQALLAPEVIADPAAIARWGGQRSPRAWAELAVREGERGGRSAEPMLARARAWLATLPLEQSP